MRVILYKVLKKNINLSFFILAPLLVAFLTLVGSIAAIDSISNQLISDAIEEKADIHFSRSDFHSASVGESVISDLKREPYIKETNYFHYSCLNGYLETPSSDSMSIESYSLFNFFSFPNSTLEPLDLYVPDDSFYASSEMAEKYDLVVGKLYTIPIYTIETSSNNASDYSFIFRSSYHLNFSGTIDQFTSDLSQLTNSGSVDLKEPYEDEYVKPDDPDMAEYTLIVSFNTLVDKDNSWIYYFATQVYFMIDLKDDALTDKNNIDEMIQLCKNAANQIRSIISNGYSTSFVNLNLIQKLRQDLITIESQSEDLWNTYSWPILTILSFPLFVTLGIVQRQISENENLITTLYSRGATKWAVGSILLFVCFFFDFIMFLLMLALDNLVINKMMSSGFTETQSSLSIIMLITIFIASLQVLAIWLEILSKSKYSKGIDLTPPIPNSAKPKFIFLVIVSVNFLLIYSLVISQIDLPFSDYLNKSTSLLLVLVIVVLFWGVWRVGLPFSTWLISIFYRIRAGNLSSYLLRGVKVSLDVTRQMLFLTFILSIILAFIFSYYDADETYNYQVLEEEIGGDIMIKTSGFDLDTILQLPGITDYSFISSRTTYSTSGTSLRMLIINASKHANFIHSHGKYNVKGSTEELFSELAKASDGILVSAEYASMRSYKISSKIKLDRIVPSTSCEFTIQGIFTRFLPFVDDEVSLVIDSSTYSSLTNKTSHPSFVMLNIDLALKDQIISQINQYSNNYAKPIYVGDERYQEYENTPTFLAKNFMYGIFSMTAIIGINLVLSVSLSRAKDEKMVVMRVLYARGFSLKVFGQLFMIAFATGIILHVLAGFLIGNLIYAIIIILSAQFIKTEYPKFGSDYQIFPKPLFAISDLTISWISIIIGSIILWNIILLLHQRFIVLRKIEQNQDVIKGTRN